jgi:hypothetical protein
VFVVPQARELVRLVPFPGPVAHQGDLLGHGMMQAALGAAETVDQHLIDKELESGADANGSVVHILSPFLPGVLFTQTPIDDCRLLIVDLRSKQSELTAP